MPRFPNISAETNTKLIMKGEVVSMVVTLTLNPAIDYVVHLQGMAAGRVNRCEYEELQFGGKGLNVSAVLTNLGIPTTALGFTAGFTGQILEDKLHEAGVATDFIRLDAGMTRINVKIRAQEVTEINGRGPRIGPEALKALVQKLDTLCGGDILVLAGSIPMGLDNAIYEDLLRYVQGRGILSVVDATGDLLCRALPYQPFLIKPNHHELGEIFSQTLATKEEILKCAGVLQQRGARNVLVSMAGEGALLLDETGETHEIRPPRGTVRNSVGAGDSMVAGFLAGWLQSGDYETALKMGTAAGSATAFSASLATGEEIMSLMRKL